jgi:cytochrome c oxidase subunit 4
MGHSHSEPHVTPLSVYYGVFGTLIVLTFVTVGVSYLGLPSTLSVIVAMGVASVKAFFVANWFMHLNHDSKFNVYLFLISLWFIGVFFIFTTFDLASRDSIMKHSGTFEARKANVEKIIVPKDQWPVAPEKASH